MIVEMIADAAEDGQIVRGKARQSRTEESMLG